MYVVEWILTEHHKVCKFSGFDGTKISHQSEGLGTAEPRYPAPRYELSKVCMSGKLQTKTRGLRNVRIV